LSPTDPIPAEIDEVITAYLLAVETGIAPDPQAILDANPHIASELRAFFDADTQFRWNTTPADGHATEELPFSLEQLGDYALEEEVGRGGMGVVYKARHRDQQHTVALKTLISGRFASREEILRFRGESEAALSLDHPGIIRVREVFQEEGLHFYTMDFVHGKSLADRLRDGPVSPSRAAKIICKAAHAVDYAHQQRVLHRDLKPGNILLTQDDQPRIADFGLAKTLGAERQLTATGEILGTLQFMAPEQAAAQHDKVAEPTDVYSLGAILFACLTGKPVFVAPTHVELLMQVLEKAPRSPRQLSPSVPPELEAIVLRCLEKDPRRRYASAGELAEDLEKFLAGQPVLATSGQTQNRLGRWMRRNQMLLAHVGALALVELFRQIKYVFTHSEDPVYAPQFTAVFVVWIFACVAFQKMHNYPRVETVAKYLWAATDIILVTVCLTMIQGPVGMLPVTYALLIVISGMFFRVQLVCFTTILCIAGFITLMLLRPHVGLAHDAAVFVSILLSIGFIVGYRVYRLRIASRLFEQRSS
jgi:serine/threonine protein kinase